MMKLTEYNIKQILINLYDISALLKDLMTSLYKRVLGFARVDPTSYSEAAQDCPGRFPLKSSDTQLSLKLSNPECSALGLFYLYCWDA